MRTQTAAELDYKIQMSKITGSEVHFEAKHFKIQFRYNFADGTCHKVDYQ